VTKHTPGPWSFLKASTWDSDLGGFFGPNGEEVCGFGDDTQYYPTEGVAPSPADMALMLAAPDLLEALKALRMQCRFPDLKVMADKAIAKAEGNA
jgi:hypothetical protein